jgi:two-component system phosphate regulon sensor histidine kinase PhoR
VIGDERTESMTLSIKWRLVFGTMLAVACGLVTARMMMIESLDRQYWAQFDEVLDSKIKLVEYGLRPLFHQPSLHPTRQIHALTHELAEQASVHVTVVAADGTVIADSSMPEADLPTVDNERARPEIQQAFAVGQGQAVRTSPTTGERMIYRAKRLTQPSEAQPIVVRVGFPMLLLDREISSLQQDFFLALGAAVFIALLSSLWVAHGIAKPLSAIVQTIRQLATGLQTTPIRTTAQDEIGLLVSTVNDMADHLHTKIAELSEDRAQLLAVLTSMVEGVMVLDRRGYVLQINPALERMFDISRAEARGRPFAELFRHQQLNELVEAILRSRTNREAEIVLPLTGRCLQIEASVAGGERDNEACVVLVFHDITELRHLETIRKDFVANVSHELRTPLTSIKGYVEALLDGAKDDPASATAFLEIILKQSDRLNLIIEDLLELSKIESGRVQSKMEWLELRPLIDRTVAMMKTLADKKGHRLVVTVDKALPLMQGDEDRLGQVLTNLLDNAIKYTPMGGTICVGAKYAQEAGIGEKPDGAIEISVSDTGIGIPEPDRPRVFERFYRVDKGRTRELGGTGLGLAIVKHIVEGQRGQVWVEANEPQGSRFVVRLPIHSSNQLPAGLKEAYRA